MACKATALVASALMILALVFMSIDAGAEAWCIQIPSPDTSACRKGGGLKNCLSKCKGYTGAQCDVLGDCYCLKCVEQGPPAAHSSIAATS